MNDRPYKRIFISACEHSAELHCANLIGAVNNRIAAGKAWPSGDRPAADEDAIEWVGFGGEKMAAAGCTLLANPVQRAAMLYNVLKQLRYYRQLIRQAREYLLQNKVDLIVVCDSPAFNFHLAKAARAMGIPVLFYVAPQLWAWAPWRIYKLRRCCTKLACILPFEEEWFRSRGIDATFVCNPLFDVLDEPVERNTKTYTDYRSDSPLIALLPGSRDAEIKTLWPAMLEIASRLKERHPQVSFVTCAADSEKLAMMRDTAQGRTAIRYESGKLYETVKACDFALVASGSATLQVASAGCPMAILYQSSKWLWHLLGRWLIRTRYLSLVNILARKELVPEYMPYFDSIEPIVERCAGLLANKSKLIETSQALTTLVKPLTATKARENTAQIVLDMIDRKH